VEREEGHTELQMIKYAFLCVTMIIVAAAAFLAGLHWKKVEIHAELSSAQ
jgi:hypothetical protein